MPTAGRAYFPKDLRVPVLILLGGGGGGDIFLSAVCCCDYTTRIRTEHRSH